jgi:prefoldin subunit 5
MAEQRQSNIDPNTGDVNTLTQLSGIGPTLAQRIVDARPFQRLDDLTRVPGIGASTLERLRPFMSIPPGDQDAAAGDREPEGAPDREVDIATPVEEAGSGSETRPLVTKAPETSLLPASEPEDPEQIEAEAVETETVEAEIAQVEADETETIGAKVIQVEEAEPEVIEAEEMEEEAELEVIAADTEEEIESEIVDAEVTEEEAVVERVEAEGMEETATAEQAAPWETEPISRFEEEGSAAEPQQPAVTRGRLRRVSLLSILLATLLATLLSLGIVSFINGGQLQFVTPAQFSRLSTRAEGLEAQAGALAQDVESLRTRLDNLELLTGRLDTLELAAQNMQADLEAATAELDRIQQQVSDLEAQAEDVDARVGTLETQSGRVETFLEGLSDLMNTLFPTEESTP